MKFEDLLKNISKLPLAIRYKRISDWLKEDYNRPTYKNMADALKLFPDDLPNSNSNRHNRLAIVKSFFEKFKQIPGFKYPKSQEVASALDEIEDQYCKNQIIINWFKESKITPNAKGMLRLLNHFDINEDDRSAIWTIVDQWFEKTTTHPTPEEVLQILRYSFPDERYKNQKYNECVFSNYGTAELGTAVEFYLNKKDCAANVINFVERKFSRENYLFSPEVESALSKVRDSLENDEAIDFAQRICQHFGLNNQQALRFLNGKIYNCFISESLESSLQNHTVRSSIIDPNNQLHVLENLFGPTIGGENLQGLFAFHQMSPNNIEVFLDMLSTGMYDEIERKLKDSIEKKIYYNKTDHQRVKLASPFSHFIPLHLIVSYLRSEIRVEKNDELGTIHLQGSPGSIILFNCLKEYVFDPLSNNQFNTEYFFTNPHYDIIDAKQYFICVEALARMIPNKIADFSEVLKSIQEKMGLSSQDNLTETLSGEDMVDLKNELVATHIIKDIARLDDDVKYHLEQQINIAVNQVKIELRKSRRPRMIANIRKAVTAIDANDLIAYLQKLHIDWKSGRFIDLSLQKKKNYDFVDQDDDCLFGQRAFLEWNRGGNNLTPDQLVQLFSKEIHVQVKLFIASEWFYKAGNNLTSDQLTQILQNLDITDRVLLLNSLFTHNRKVANYIAISESLDDKTGQLFSMPWTVTMKKTVLSWSELQEILYKGNSPKLDEFIMEIVQEYFKRNETSFEKLKTLLNNSKPVAAELTEEEKQQEEVRQKGNSKLIISWFKASEPRDNFTIEQLIELMSLVERDLDKYTLFASYFNQYSERFKNVTPPVFAQILNLIDCDKANSQVQNNNNFYSTLGFLKAQETSELRFQYLEILVKHKMLSGFPLNTVKVFLEQLFTIKDLPLIVKFLEETYPESEVARLKQLHDFIESRRPKDQFVYNQETELALCGFLKSIRSDSDTALFVRTISTTFNLNARQVVKLIGERFKAEYRSIYELLESKEIASSVRPERIREVQLMFSNDLAGLTLADVFSYYNVADPLGLVGFALLLKDEVKQEIDRAFIPSSNSCYLKGQEYQSLQVLVPSLALPKVRSLNQYLQRKVAIKTVTKDEIPTYRINFSAYDKKEGDKTEESYSKELCDNLNTKYRNFLLASENPSEESILKFFEDLLKISFDKFAAKNKKDFCIFFNTAGVKERIGWFIQQPDGIHIFQERILAAIKDGCHANITAVFNKELYKKAAKDDIDATILCLTYYDDIFDRMAVNNVDVLYGGSDNCYINPIALLPAMDKKFSDTNERIEYLRRKIFKDGSPEEFVKILQNYDDKLTAGTDAQYRYELKFIDNLCGYFLLQNISDIAGSKYLEEFNKTAEKHIANLQKQIKEFEDEKRKRRFEPAGEQRRAVIANAAELRLAQATPLRGKQKKQEEQHDV